MESTIIVDENLTKAEKYELMIQHANALISDEPDLIANMANIAALIKEIFGFHWVGFYRVIEDDLVLGPFQGPIACTRIKIPNGVCGTCVAQKETIVVPDVHQFPGHIACSPFSNSEIVVPFLSDGRVKWILDIDSANFNDFDELDVSALEKIIDLGHQKSVT